MRTLSATLLAAQKSVSSLPYVKAVFSDFYGDRNRARFTRFYTGAEALDPCAAVVAADGSLVRARNEAGTLYVSRVTTPGSGSTYSSWTSLDAGISTTAEVALCRRDNDDLVLFNVDADNDTLQWRVSADDGASWGAAATVLNTGAASKRHLAAAAQGSGGDDMVLLWKEADEIVYRSRYDGTSWGARTAWTNSVATVTGLAITWFGDFQVNVAGTEVTTLAPSVWACRFGDGFAATADVWGGLRKLAEASADSDVTYALAAVTLWQGLWMLFFVESYAGTTAYDRLMWTNQDGGSDFNTEAWREATPFDYEGNTQGIAIAAEGSDLWLVSSDGVWYGASHASLDVSADVIEAEADVDLDGGRVVVVLQNEGGAYTAYGSGALAVLQRGSRLELSPGYTTSGGNEVNSTLAYRYWVEKVELVTNPSPQPPPRSRGGGAASQGPRLVVTARDAWWLAERYRARRQFYFAAGGSTVFGLIASVLERAGFEASLGSQNSSSISSGSFEPEFTVHPGEAAATAVRRLLAKVPDLGYWKNGTLHLLEARSADAAGYDFGPADHVIRSARYVDLGPAYNHGRGVGTAVLGESYDFADIEAMGERLRTKVELNADAAGEVDELAESVTRQAAIEARGDTIDIFGVHCGVELLDVVTVTDAEAGLSDAKRRVLGYAWRYRPARGGEYAMTLRLGAV